MAIDAAFDARASGTPGVGVLDEGLIAIVSAEEVAPGVGPGVGFGTVDGGAVVDSGPAMDGRLAI